MKRHFLYILSGILSLCSCTVESAENSGYSEKALQHFASEVAEEKILFPMAVFETVLLIEEYEGLSAEEKVELKHIFSSLIKVSDEIYTMEKFFNLKVNTDGKSINEKGAEWAFQTDYSFYDYNTRSFRAHNSPENEDCDFMIFTDVKTSYDQIYVDRAYDDDAYFSWIIEMEGAFESYEGKVVLFRSDGPLKRKVTRSDETIAESMVTMEGKIIVTIINTDGKQLDEVTYDMSGSKVNHYYQF